MIKSVLLFTKTPVHIVIFTDEISRPHFHETLTKWKTIVDGQMDFELQKIKFPEAHEEDWLNLFSKCAAQRLFIPVSHPAFRYIFNQNNIPYKLKANKTNVNKQILNKKNTKMPKSFSFWVS